MLKAATYIATDVESHGVLAALLLRGGDGGRYPDCTGWDLVVTGHSLGAGACV